MTEQTPLETIDWKHVTVTAAPGHVTFPPDVIMHIGDESRRYVPAEPEDSRIKRAHAIIPALQRVKNVPLGGDLLPAALEAIDALDALEADR